MFTWIRRTAISAAVVGSALVISGAIATAAPATPASPTLPTLSVKSKYFTTGETTITCDPGWVATGGGVGADDPSNTYVARTEPFPSSGTPTGWKGNLFNRASNAPSSGAIYVVCAR